MPWEGEEVGPYDGVGLEWVRYGGRVGQVKVGPGSGVGWAEVDEGGAYFPPGFGPIREEEDLIVIWG